MPWRPLVKQNLCPLHQIIYRVSSSPLVYFLSPIVMYLRVFSLSILTCTLMFHLPNPSINHISAFHKHSPHKASFSQNLGVSFLHLLLLFPLTAFYWPRPSSQETSIFYFIFLPWVKTKKNPPCCFFLILIFSSCISFSLWWFLFTVWGFFPSMYINNIFFQKAKWAIFFLILHQILKIWSNTEYNLSKILLIFNCFFF